MAEQFAEGRVTAVEILEQFLHRIKILNPRLNAVVYLNDEAMADAQASAERFVANKPLSRIDGLPILIKDNFVVRDQPTTWGSKLYENRVSSHDEIPVEKLRQAGAVLVGKTNLPEFTIEGFTDNKLFGVTPNPWDLSTTPAGSSGGSVAAVAAGLIPMSIGTDGGGSVRRPAAFTNLVGLKTTLGRIPRGGGMPQLLLDMEVVGPLTRSVRDQALLFDVLAQPDVRDHRSLRFDGADSLTGLFNAPGPLRILAVEQFADAPVDPDIRTSFKQMVGLMKSMGHRVKTGELPLDIRALNENWASIANISLGLLLKREPQMRKLASRKYVEWGDQSYDATHLLKILEIISDLRTQAAGAFKKIDIIMTPCCAAMPWSTSIPFPAEIDNQPIGPRGAAVFSGWVNACGHPAISVPGLMSEQSMPIGIQFVGDFGRDELLLRLAQQVENEQSWLDEWPPIAFLDQAP